MVHAKSGLPNCEVASFQSVCSSGIMALKAAYSQIKNGEKTNAITVGSELASRLFKSSRFDAQGRESVPFDTEFLRWMLSDGSGAFVVENKPNKNGLSLRIDWIDLKSHANDFPVCMFTGKNDNKNEDEMTWLDYPNYESASKVGAISLKQDIRLLDKVIKVGIAHFFSFIEEGKMNAEKID